MPRLPFLVVVLFTLVVACSRASRGDSCNTDADCAKGLECLGGGADKPTFCTTRCSSEFATSCPTGWKCVELEHFSALWVCARS